MKKTKEPMNNSPKSAILDPHHYPKGQNGLMLHKGNIVDAGIISTPSSTKNESGQCDSEMHQTREGNE